MASSGKDSSRKGRAPNESVWHEVIAAAPRAPALETDTDADVVLVGGGLTSLVAAYELKTREPGLDVVVLESDYVGFGSSGRNAGMVLHEPHLDRVADRGAEAVRWTYERTVEVVDWIEETGRREGFDCELERTGYLEIAFYRAHLRRIEATRAAAARLGIELGLLDGAAVRAAIHSDRFEGALVYPRAALLHPGKYVVGLKQALLRRGVRLFEETPVATVEPGAVVTVRTARARVRAGRAIVGLNAYLPEVRVRAVPRRAVSLFSFIILTEPLSEDAWRRLGWEGRQGYSDLRRVHNYVRPVGRRILFGGRVLYHFGLAAPRRVERIYDRLYREMVRTFPFLDGVGVTHRWCGPVALTWRRTPLLGRAGSSENLFYAFGYSGMGVSLGTLAGRVLADAALGELGRWRRLVYLDDRAWPLPPEPLRFAAFEASYLAMRLLDAWDAARGRPRRPA